MNQKQTVRFRPTLSPKNAQTKSAGARNPKPDFAAIGQRFHANSRFFRPAGRAQIEASPTILRQAQALQRLSVRTGLSTILCCFAKGSTKALKPRAKRYEVRDAYNLGFSVRIGSNARKTFTQYYRLGLRYCREILGIVPRTSLAEARSRAIELLRPVDDGINLSTTRRQLDMRVIAAFAQFIERHAKPCIKTGRECEHNLKRELVRAYGEMDIR